MLLPLCGPWGVGRGVELSSMLLGFGGTPPSSAVKSPGDLVLLGPQVGGHQPLNPVPGRRRGPHATSQVWAQQTKLVLGTCPCATLQKLALAGVRGQSRAQIQTWYQTRHL